MIIRIADIRRDGGTQFRKGILLEVLDDYAAALARGDVLPSPIVFYDGADHWLADGFHTTAAHEKNGAAELDADVRNGTRRDAVLYALTEANRRHGLRYTIEEKRARVEALIADPEWAGWANTLIAERCGVSEHLVRSIRPNLAPGEVGSEQTTRIGKDGRARKLPKKKVEPAAPSPPAAEPRPYTEALFGGTPDTAEAPTDEEAAADLGVKLTPELAAFGAAFEEGRRTAPPGATTIVTEETDHGTGTRPPEQDEAGALPDVREEAQAADGGGESGSPEVGRRDEAPMAERPLPAVGAGGDETPCVQADESGTDVADRIRFLRLSPISKGCPAEDKPAFAAALREWADSLAPDVLYGVVHDDRAGLVRELEGVKAEREAARETVRQLAGRAERAEARVRELAAESERRYDCHAGPGTTEPACGACISCLNNVIVAQETELAALRTGRLQNAITDEADGGAESVPTEDADPTAAPPAQAELTYEPDPELQRRPPKKAAKGKAPKPTLALPPRRLVGDQVLVETKKHGIRKAVVALSYPNEGTFAFVLRADVARGLKGIPGDRSLPADRLRPDPGLGDRKAAIVEAIGILEEHVNVPVTWVEALRVARETA